ncbi:MAG TPA: VWA domain-containing protein, partial [Xanthomonadales bacterium]|nr:VWA domain-containing protein [Xanthomonadales bacterium]
MDLSLSQFSFLRPLWLLGLLLLPLVWWLWRHRRTQRGAWAAAVDAHLLPHLLQQVEVRGAHRSSLLWLLTGALAIVALAGPSWHQQAAPLWQKEAPLVIALDMSAAMRAADLPPSRLVQVRAKLGKLLQQRRSGQVGLLAYAGDAFTVAPITRDGRTVSALLDSLDPDVMPVEGQRSDRAIKLALKMLADSDASSGEILLVTDHGDTDGNFAAVQARTAGISVSVLGVGTLAGAPLISKNGFITGPDGQPRLARLDPASLAALAAAGGGRYAALSTDDSDLAALAVLDPVGRAASTASNDAGGTRDDVGVTRSDDGYWLLLAVLPLMLLGFRRGWLAVLPLVLGLGLVLPGEQVVAQEPAADAAPQAQQAPDSAPPESGFSWDALWQRADQRAHAALKAGDTERARQLAPDPALKGAAAFRGDDYAAAAEAWAQDDAADAHY